MVGVRSQQKQVIPAYLGTVRSATWFGEAESPGRELVNANPVVSALKEGK